MDILQMDLTTEFYPMRDTLKQGERGENLQPSEHKGKLKIYNRLKSVNFMKYHIYKRRRIVFFNC